MNLDEKKKIILNNKDPIVQSINSYLDSIYNLLDKNENKKSYTKDNQLIELINELKDDCQKFESVRRILIMNFPITEEIVKYSAIALNFSKEVFKNQIKNYEKAIEDIDLLIKQLLEKSL